MGAQEFTRLSDSSSNPHVYPIRGGSGTGKLAPPWSRSQVSWHGQGYFVLRLATEETSRWCIGASFRWNDVLPHERTFRRSAADKASVIASLKMNPWPSHLTCKADPVAWREALAGAVAQIKPVLDTDHVALWRLSALPKGLSFTGPLVVLDGHHSRKAQQHLRLPGLFGWMEPLEAPQLQVRAIHRSGVLADWLAGCVERSDLAELRAAPAEAGWHAGSSLAFEVVQANRRFWCEVKNPVKGEAVVDALARLAKGRVLLKASSNFDEILGWLADMEIDTALRLPPPTKDYVRARAVAGELFPQKATYFFPKIPFGMLVADLR